MVFPVNHLFFESERAIRSFKRANHFFTIFVKSDKSKLLSSYFCKEYCCFFKKEQRVQFPLFQRARRAKRAMKSDSIFCIGHKNGKAW